MKSSGYRYTYGPVSSRRLGSSLGIDLVPYKICTYDCIYCQLGRTTKKTILRKEYIPTKDIIQEIKKRLSGDSPIDYITLAGSGEPTLHSKIGQIIDRIKELTSIPIAVITNGSLLHEAAVQDELKKADLVMPSLDAGSEKIYKKINRPHKDLNFESIINGLLQFGRRFKNSIWLEVFWVSKVNDSIDEVINIANIVNQLKPNKVQFNTVARPPAEEYAQSVPKTNLAAIMEYFMVDAEIINGSISGTPKTVLDSDIKKDEILTLLERRPCTAKNIADGLGTSINEVIKQLELLSKEEIMTLRFGNDRLFYKRKRA